MTGKAHRSSVSASATSSSAEGVWHAFDARKILDMMPGLVAYFDTDLVFRYVNPAYAHVRGRDVESVIGRTCLEIVGPRNFATIHTRLERAASGETVSFEYDLISRGLKRRVHAHYQPDFDENGKVRGVLATLADQDSTEEMRERAVRSEALFEDAFLNAPIGMLLVNPEGRMQRTNRSFTSMLGRSHAELMEMGFAEISHPADVEPDIAKFNEILRGESSGYTIDKRYIHADGNVVEAVLSVSAMRNPEGEIVQFISHVLDVTEARRAERTLRAANAQLSLAMEALRGGFWHLDLSNWRFETSDQLAEYIGGPGTGRLDFNRYVDLINEADRAGAHFQGLIQGHAERARVHYRISTRLGERWFQCDRRLIRDGAGKPAAIVGVVIDITEDREQLEQSLAAAESDALTGLLNRRGLRSRFEREALALTGGWAVLLVDLDGFKQINDMFGHGTGDEVLVRAAKAMRNAVREGDLVARLGGDEFALILPSADRALLERIAPRLTNDIYSEVTENHRTLIVSCSIGATLVGEPGLDLDKAIAKADAALYAAKHAGKHTWRIG